MVKHAVVIVLFLDQRGAFVLTFHRAANRALQQMCVEIVLCQIILRPGAYNLSGEGVVTCRAQNNDWQPGFFDGQQSHL